MNVAFGVIGLLVGLVGAISGIQWITGRVKRVGAGKAHQKALAAAPGDYSYKSYDAAVRISDKGVTWYIRTQGTAIIKSDWKGIVETVQHRDGVVPGSFTHEVAPTGIEIKAVPTEHPAANKYHLTFPQTLNAGDKLSYTYSSHFRKIEPIRPNDEFAITFIGRDCEHLVLRVVFDGFEPKDVKYKIMDRMLVKEVWHENMTPDPVSGEVRKDIPLPNKNLLYGLFWVYNQ